MRKYFLLIIVFTKCAMDFSVSSYLVNDSNDSIDILIQYNKAYIDSIFQGTRQNSIKSLRNSNDANGIKYEFDSLNLSSHYKLNPGDKIQIDKTVGGYGIVPDHVLVKQIIIRKNGIVTMYNQKKIDTLFKKSNRALWEWTIH
jgi:hypothetical protein